MSQISQSQEGLCYHLFPYLLFYIYYFIVYEGHYMLWETMIRCIYAYKLKYTTELCISTKRNLRKWIVQLCSLSKGWEYTQHLSCFLFPLARLPVMLIHFNKYWVLLPAGLILSAYWPLKVRIFFIFNGR